MIHQKRGRILNISSLAGVKMMQAPVHYSTPGVLNEGVSGNLPPAKQREYIGHCALGRLGSVEEIAEVVAFFVSDKNSYMNGATTVIDGGV
jgi:NAD(P)-dependent dehydrogenase (short-subunit alcohol dehydrogenase family)